MSDIRTDKLLTVYFIISILLMGFIFVQSSLPADVSMRESSFLVPFVRNLFKIDAESASTIIRKFAHFIEYGFLGASLTLTANRFWITEPPKQCGLNAFIIGSIYSITDELHQVFVDGRSCEFRDIMIDMGGVLFGVLIVCFILYALEKKKKAREKELCGT